MNRSRTSLAVLHTTKFGERSLIVHCLSPHFGRCGVIAPASGGRRGGSRIFQPLSILEAVVEPGRGGSLLVLDEVAVKRPALSLRSDIVKSAVAVFMCEVLYRTVRDGGLEEGLFEWVERTVMELEAVEERGVKANFPLYFIIGLCRALGLGPNDNYSGENRLFSVGSAEFGSVSDGLSEEDSRLLHLCLGADLDALASIPANGAARRSLVDGMVRYLGYHCDMKLEIKSLDVLHEVLC